MTAPTKLTTEINGRVMEADGLFNMTLSLAVSLLAKGDPVYIMLEPGDCTRYEFSIVPTRSMPGFPHHNWTASKMWLITRFNGGRPSEATFYWPGNEFELAYVSNANEHTLLIFQWWIPLLWEMVYG